MRRLWIHMVVAALVCITAGCAPTRYVPVETVRTEYKDREIEKFVADTVRDTRFILVKGDTVIDWRDRWHTQREYVRDTCYVERHDSIPVPYPVERQLSRWEYTRLNSWWWIATALALCVGWICRKPLIGLARRIISKN